MKDRDILSSIARRAQTAFADAGQPRDLIDCMMDIDAVHQAIGLRLEDLNNADAFNFAHDVFGIARHLNRSTGELKGFFLPRFSSYEAPQVEV